MRFATSRFSTRLDGRTLALGMAALAMVAMVFLTFHDAKSSPGTFVQDVPAQKSKAEVEADHPNITGPVNIVAPDSKPAASATDPDSLERHGAYRIVVDGFVGRLTREMVASIPPRGFQSDDPAEVSKSPLFREVSGLPEDWVRVAIDTYDGDSNTAVRQAFVGPNETHQTLQVTRLFRAERPLDVFSPPSDETGWLRLSTARVGPYEAIILSPTEFSRIPEADQLARVQFFDGTVETILTGTGLTVDQLTRIAAGLAEGGD
ncbi:MAG: hypothetical protein IH609_11700 [Dehalococcoidia bacterium]|nr:hypothetical protein [Dehalococcoidia bacterium]